MKFELKQPFVPYDQGQKICYFNPHHARLLNDLNPKTENQSQAAGLSKVWHPFSQKAHCTCNFRLCT